MMFGQDRDGNWNMTKGDSDEFQKVLNSLKYNKDGDPIMMDGLREMMWNVSEAAKKQAREGGANSSFPFIDMLAKPDEYVKRPTDTDKDFLKGWPVEKANPLLKPPRRSSKSKSIPMPSSPSHKPSAKKKYRIPTDVYDSADALILRADLPGVTKDRVSIDHHRGVLTITASRRTAAEPPSGITRTTHHNEIASGSTSRSFRVPDTVDVSRTGASFENGVLTVTLRKKPTEKPMQIPIS